MSNNKSLNEEIDDVIKEMEQEGVTLENFKEKDPEGLGDTIANVLNKFGFTEEWVEKAFGIKGCGCQKRKQFLNQIFPYRKKEKGGE